MKITTVNPFSSKTKTVDDLLKESDTAFLGLTKMVEKVEGINSQITEKITEIDAEVERLNKAKQIARSAFNKNNKFAKNVKALYE